MSGAALVIGGTGLLGSEICRRLARDGAAVVVGYRRSAGQADELVAELRDTGADAWSVPADLDVADRAAQAVGGAAKLAGPVGVLVMAAGITLRSPAVTTSPQATEQIMATNVIGTIAVVRAALRPMMRARWGRVILLGSRAGTAGMPGQSIYSASKAALVGYAASIAGEVGGLGVTVNVVVPGAIEEPAGAGRYSEAEREAVRALIGARRLGRPAEVAAVVSFLASADAAYVNGACIPVDGAARF